MLDPLHARAKAGKPVRVGIIGLGAMGLGVALQVGQTPGMEVVFLADKNLKAAKSAAAEVYRVGNVSPVVGDDPLALIDGSDQIAFDVLVECTTATSQAAHYCMAAMGAGAHVVLMNAEVDLAFGRLLRSEALRQDVVITSDAGDQHGVLMTMIEEIALWGIERVQAGNIKGFLDRYATAEGLAHEAAIRHLNPVQCCAYTDGTKLSIEMALVANGTGMTPKVRGMEGPRCADVQEAMTVFDFSSYAPEGHIDYILGAKPGGGVYVVGKCEDPLQQRYLSYYKLGDGPYYLFYRPYHLCHLETPRAIMRAAVYGEAVLAPGSDPVADVYTFAKRDLRAGETFSRSIGSDFFYGMVDRCDTGAAQNLMPICSVEADDHRVSTILRDIPKDSPVHPGDIEFEESEMHRLLAACDAKNV